MPNQYKPTPPLDELTPHILRYWKTRLNDKEIVLALQKHFDTERYGIGLTKFRQIRVDMGLERSRRQGHTIETIREAVMELRQMFPHAGTREMIGLLFHEKNMSVAKSVMMSYFAAYEPELVWQRKARRLKRKHFWAAGVNDLFAVDQHDKWLRFGLGLHTGVEPFSGRIMWIRVWHSNRNPQLILSYYLDTITELGHMPLITQSDLGTENYGIANAQTLLRQRYDPTLQGTLQHRWMRTKKNVMPEITWSQLRRRFTPGFETLLDEGVIEGWYDSGNTLHMMVFRWVFIPWLQQELNAYRDRVNNTAKRRDRNKILPHGVPNLIYDSPEDFGALDFKVSIDHEGIDYVRNFYINASNPVFDIVPPMLGDFIEHCYDAMGRPAVTRLSVWDVYRNILSAVQLAENPHPNLLLTENEDAHASALQLIGGHADLPFNEEMDGMYYMGGVRGGLGLGTS
ncbi:uncharacterized protein F5891DRAFT_1130312 [Suillus fuscotomentosus]|uniref:Integrase core domain-containing protein n=1 Tax=Suillus fuscotomentosus TaxID=1912939 RepID=A0AAD4DZD6_9AGAM|nr:uncharacterized protein F5891DRAFT_1130312 [Suillus fuscotomentosus]KAG1896356.1 hypothetical protein F5891DRAFT_1130312 [Suillus fuscotomentosus]